MEKFPEKIVVFLISLTLGLGSSFLSLSDVHADHVVIGTGSARPQIKLIVGPATNPDALPAAVTFDLSASPGLLGTGPVAGTPNILIEVGYRGVKKAPAATVNLIATAPVGLTYLTNTIPVTDISWTVAAPAAAPGAYITTLPAATFISGSQVVGSMVVPKKGWMGGELTFFFANSSIYAAGVYFGVVTYTVAVL